MSFINGSPLSGMGATPAFEYERPESQFAQTNGEFSTTPQYGDGFRSTPIALPAYPNQNLGGSPSYGTTSDNSYLSSIMSSITSLMQQLSSYFGFSNANGSATGGGESYPSAPSQPSPETAFTSATASSTGDPHDAFDGTTTQGAGLSDKWDSMKSHGDLLNSNSFQGGYRLSTTTTAPDSKGVTYNASATVTTQNGNDAVTLDKDGSYVVTENGQNVSLAQGQATQIGHDETVTLNADKSLTIVDTNHRGGTLTTTLSLNGNGVDVNASGTNVDLGGYLVDKTDRDADSITYQQQQPSPYRYGNSTEPLGAGELEFA